MKLSEVTLKTILFEYKQLAGTRGLKINKIVSLGKVDGKLGTCESRAGSKARDFCIFARIPQMLQDLAPGMTFTWFPDPI